MRSFRRQVTLFVAGVSILFSFSGCSKEPTAELAAAKAALKAAQDVEADKYMAKNFQNMKKALENAEGEIALQKSKFILNRKYKIVTQNLVKITEVATEIKNEAPKAREATIAQVKENLGLVDGMLKETANDIKKPSRSKDKNLIAELKSDLSAADSAAVRAKAEYEAGNVLGASEHLATVQSYIKKITDTLKPPKDEPM
jgi:hypothetical protein